MRCGAVMLACLLAGPVAGCKGNEKQAEAAVAAGEVDPELSNQEQELLARRDALLAARRDIRDKRSALDEERAQVAATGGDTSEIDKRATALYDEERKLETESDQVLDKVDELLEQQRASLAAAGERGNLSAREGSMAARERVLANREARLAERESALSRREEQLATKWKESCAVGTPTTIVQTVDVKGSKYTKSDVEPLLNNARKEMSSKGILSSDLPDHASGLERDATAAMAKGDYGSARFAATQLYQTVKGIKIDKNFVSAKWARLNRAMKGKRLSSEQEQLLTEAASSIADGKFAAANKKLNRLYASN
jgi:hypothetical protein